jgi:hypothetical protein
LPKRKLRASTSHFHASSGASSWGVI